jgi:hypothetical protein
MIIRGERARAEVERTKGEKGAEGERKLERMRELVEEARQLQQTSGASRI